MKNIQDLQKAYKEIKLFLALQKQAHAQYTRELEEPDQYMLRNMTPQERKSYLTKITEQIIVYEQVEHVAKELEDIGIHLLTASE